MSSEELDARLNEEIPNLPTAVREWYILAGNWNQGGLNVWFKPEDLRIADEANVIVLLTDDYGINHWSICVSDVHHEDPPVVLLDVRTYEFVCSRFSEFAATMVMNDFIYADETTGDPIELDPNSVRATLTCPFPSRSAYFTDAPLESATIVAYVYPSSTAQGKSRTPEGRALLESLQVQTTPPNAK